MTQRRRSQLDTVEAVLASRESGAARELAAYEGRLAEARERLRLLESSRDEQASMGTSMSTLGASEWANRAAFLNRLAEAIRAQNNVVHRAEADCELARGRLTSLRQRTQAVGKVCEKRALQQRMENDRREQREMDERLRKPGSDDTR